jgi:RNA polymerase sigma-70 factor (ECF subfamily)
MMGNPFDAEDITQEVFFRLWQRIQKFDPAVARLSTWLHKIAHNLCIDHFRKQKPDGMLDPDELTGGMEPPTELLQRLQTTNIGQAMQELPERQRSAIVMCHYQGLSNREAAVILDVSVDALESLLSRGRRKLRALLEGELS